MARTVNQQEHGQRRDAIIEATRQLIYRKGYERLTVEDIRGQAGMSNGAFFHYFRSKPDVLEAVVERMRRDGVAPLTALLGDPELAPLAKLQQFFGTLDTLRTRHQVVVVDLLRVWYTDDNTRVRQRVADAVRRHRQPLLVSVIEEGVRTGVFSTAYPDQAADILLTLIDRMGAVHAQALLADRKDRDREAIISDILRVRAAFLEAIERTLGAPADSLPRGTTIAVAAWLDALDPDQA